VLIVHDAVKTDPGVEAATSVRLERKILDPAEPIPPGAIWIDMVEPTVDEDQKVERYLGAKVPSRSDPDFAHTKARRARLGLGISESARV
jgi:hypothetical protein